jgi:hypothetical protein
MDSDEVKRLNDERDEIRALLPHGVSLYGWNSVNEFSTITDGRTTDWSKSQVDVLRKVAVLTKLARFAGAVLEGYNRSGIDVVGLNRIARECGLTEILDHHWPLVIAPEVAKLLAELREEEKRG